VIGVLEWSDIYSHLFSCLSLGLCRSVQRRISSFPDS